MRNEYQRRRDIVVECLKTMPNVKFAVPNGAFYIMAELPIDHCDNFCKWLLENFDYEKNTVMISPANGFYSNINSGTKQVRIAYVLNESDLKLAMQCLKLGLEKYNQK